MRPSRLIAVFLACLFIAGCGADQQSSSPTTTPGCTPADGPTDDTVSAEIAKLPAAPWIEVVRGHTDDCSLHWVAVTSGDASDSPGQVLFFDRKTPLGTATPDPRPYVTISASDGDIAAVQYKWRQGQDPACCPSGAATVRFKVQDGKLKALDPIPAQ
ncbi:LppP/LprE family lipoprotein [Mycobacterium sp. NPDC048908]|uniref:LppP/LprE family lipoprotein n=1 Tax=Mycobacterium sp. NPDC048908 TaxID=3364292 RepID=UPI00371BD6A9